MSRRTPLFNAHEVERVFYETSWAALVLRSARNIAWLTGMLFPGTLGRLQDFAHSPRAAVLVWPRDGEPTLFVSQIKLALAQRDSWIEDIRPFTEYSESPYRMAAERIRELGHADGRIGVERREMGVENWEEFSLGLPGAELVDCTARMESARNVKTPAEIDFMRTAAEIQDRAHLHVFGNARPGATERQLHARMIAYMLEHGCESAHGMMQASSTPETYGGEGDASIDPGVAVRTDYVCYYKGYSANLSRMAVMGASTDDQRRIYHALRDVHRSTISEMLRPGVEAQAVHAFTKRRFAEEWFDWNVSLVGHSAGIWWHQEEPMLVPGENRRLREGMVVCLEPILESFWHLQDQVLITETEPELLSTVFDTDELFVMG